MLMPDISLLMGYCFDINLLSLFIWGIVLISAYCLCLSVADFGLNTLDFDISLLSLFICC